jgi:hypothetical protein
MSNLVRLANWMSNIEISPIKPSIYSVLVFFQEKSPLGSVTRSPESRVRYSIFLAQYMWRLGVTRICVFWTVAGGAVVVLVTKAHCIGDSHKDRKAKPPGIDRCLLECFGRQYPYRTDMRHCLSTLLVPLRLSQLLLPLLLRNRKRNNVMLCCSLELRCWWPVDASAGPVR